MRSTTATTLTISVDDNVLHFPNSDGIETRGLSAIGDLTRRLNGRTSVYGEYNFQDFWYPGYSVSMKVKHRFRWSAAQIDQEFNRECRRRPGMDYEYCDFTGSEDTLSYAANAAMTYTRKLDSFDVHYSRGVNSGSGFLVGGQLEDTSQAISCISSDRAFRSVSLVDIQRTLAFINNGATNGGIWFSARQPGNSEKSFIVFANYSGRGQNTTSTLPGNVLNETRPYGVVRGFGFSPKQQRARQ